MINDDNDDNLIMIIIKMTGRCRVGARARRLVRPVHLLRVFLLGVLESNLPGDPL